MSERRVLSNEARDFRSLIIERLWGERGVYLTEDSFVGECVVCGASLGAHFHGYAARATLICHGGCTEAQIATAIGLGVPR